MQVVTAVAKMREGDIQKPPGIAEAIDWLAALELLGVDDARRGRRSAARSAACSSTARTRTSSAPRGWRASCEARDRRARPARRWSPRFGRRLHEAGVPVTPERSARFAQALTLTRPVARTRLYWTARAVLVSDPAQVKAFDAVFFAVFGSRVRPTSPRPPPERRAAREAAPPDERPARRAAARRAGGGASPRGRRRRADAARDVAGAGGGQRRGAPARQALRRARAGRARAAVPADDAAASSPRRCAARAAPSATAAASTSTCAARCAAACAPAATRSASRTGAAASCRRRLVLLCDISGSMEPYARAYLQFLTCAGRADAEAFVFATRLTRITRALATRSPERAIQRAAAAAPDWSSGTRIGDALRAFNDRHGRRGMARGAVIVILSDGWERGEPALVGREMERLSRLAYRIVWVNPRVGAAGFVPRAGGMVGGAAVRRRARQRPQPRRAGRGRRRDRRRARRAARAAGAGGRGGAVGERDAGGRAARWRCRAATARAEEGRRRDGACEDLHLPGLRPARRAAAPGRRPAAGVLRPRGPQRADRAPGASERRSRVADEAYRAVFLRVHPTGKMVLSLTTEADGNEGALRAARRRRARRAGARRQGRARRREPLRRRSRLQHQPVRRRRRRRSPARRRRSAPRRSCSRARRWRRPPTSCAGTTARSSAAPARGRSPTSPSTPTAPARSRPASRAGSTRRPSTATDATLGPENGDADGPHRQGRRGGQGRPQPRDRGHALAGRRSTHDARRADRRRALAARASTAAAASRRSATRRRPASRRRSTRRCSRAGRSATARARVTARDGGFDVEGELDLLGVTPPARVRAVASTAATSPAAPQVKQTDWRIKPYSALFGTLKVADVVEVSIDATLPKERIDG